MANSTTERPQPYIAFTGVTHEDQIPEVANIFQSAGFNPDASHRPIAGVAFDLQGRYAGQPIYAGKENIPRIIRAARAVGSVSLSTCIHFNGSLPQILEHEILGFLDTITREGLPSILQLNGQPPHPNILEAIHKRFPREELPDFRLAIQIKPETDPHRAHLAALALKGMYGGLIDYVNMNSSAGTGRRFNIHERKAAFVALWETMQDISIGLPGGLSADNAKDVCEEIDTVLNGDDPERSLVFCADAEGQLKYPDGPKAGHLDMKRARGYILGTASAILRGGTPPD